MLGVVVHGGRKLALLRANSLASHNWTLNEPPGIVRAVRFIVVLAALLLASCGETATSDRPSDQAAGPSDPTTSGQIADGEAAVDGPVMRYPSPPSDNVGMAAEVRGTLQLDGACLYIFLDEAGERYPVLWPAGTTWDEQNQSVTPPAGSPMPVGSDVYGGGGYVPTAHIERLAGPDAAALASSCVDNEYGEIAVVNNQADAIALAND
jgi:hypothetical protein